MTVLFCCPVGVLFHHHHELLGVDAYDLDANRIFAPGKHQDTDIPVLQLDRWETLLEDHVARARQAGLDADFVKAVFELIHTQAVQQQL